MRICSIQTYYSPTSQTQTKFIGVELLIFFICLKSFQFPENPIWFVTHVDKRLRRIYVTPVLLVDEEGPEYIHNFKKLLRRISPRSILIWDALSTFFLQINHESKASCPLRSHRYTGFTYGQKPKKSKQSSKGSRFRLENWALQGLILLK